MDGYSGFQGGYPPGSGPGYNEPMQRSPSQTNSQSPHSGKPNQIKQLIISLSNIHYSILILSNRYFILSFY